MAGSSDGTGPNRLGPVAKVVSGGQSGVDRAALDLAADRGIPAGGWVPAGGWAEDLPEPPGVLARHPRLRPTGSADPAERTMRNVRDSDATLVLTRTGVDSTGTTLTVTEATRRGRPHLVVDIDAPSALAQARSFVAALPTGTTLNVAGPRESQAPGIEAAARDLLTALAASFDRPPPE